jgi:hypothetical protein
MAVRLGSQGRFGYHQASRTWRNSRRDRIFDQSASVVYFSSNHYRIATDLVDTARRQKPIIMGDQANFAGIVGDHPLIGNQSSLPISSETLRDYHWQFDSQMAVAIAARLRNRPEWQDKIIIDITPEYLWSLFRGRTSMQGGRLAEPFLNKWMVVCGPFRNIRQLTNQMCVTFAHRATMEIVFMYFNEDWRGRLEIIIQDQKISVVGRIDSVNNDTLMLEDCELVQ